MGFVTAPEFTIASAVTSPAGTVAFAYPAGFVQADFTSANASPTAYLLLNDNDRYEEVDDEFDISYGASTVTLTNKVGYTWPIGTKVFVALARVSPSETFLQAAAVPNTTGTMTGTTDGVLADIAPVATAGGNTYADAAINTAITAANLQIKELQVKLNALLTSLRAAGHIA